MGMFHKCVVVCVLQTCALGIQLYFCNPLNADAAGVTVHTPSTSEATANVDPH